MLTRMNSILRSPPSRRSRSRSRRPPRRRRPDRRTLAGVARLLDSRGHARPGHRQVRDAGRMRRPGIDGLGGRRDDRLRRKDRRPHARGRRRPAARDHEGRLQADRRRATWSPSARRAVPQVRIRLQRRTRDPRERASTPWRVRGVDRRAGDAGRQEQRRARGALPRGRRRRARFRKRSRQKLHEHSMARTAAMLAVTEPPSLGTWKRRRASSTRVWSPPGSSRRTRSPRQKPAPLNARQLEQLADHGVPASVIDVMVGAVVSERLRGESGRTVEWRDRIPTVRTRRTATAGSHELVQSDHRLRPFGSPDLRVRDARCTGARPSSTAPYARHYAWQASTNAPVRLRRLRVRLRRIRLWRLLRLRRVLPYYGGYFGGGPVVVPIVTGLASTHRRMAGS